MKRNVCWAIVLTLACSCPLTADAFAHTGSSSCQLCPGTLLQSYGTTSWGGPSVSTGFAGFAQTAWFPESFGMFARADANTTGNGGGMTAYAYGLLSEPVLIPAQAGMQNGDAGVFTPHYHLDGVVSIDWTGFNVPESNVVGGGVDLVFQITTFDNPNGVGNPTSFSNLMDERWRADQLTVVVDQDFSALVPFRFGEVFYFQTFFRLSAQVFSANPPSIGYAQGDFSHTGKLTGVTVFDRDGSPIANPSIDSGINFTNPGVSTVPLPPSAWLLATCIAGTCGRRWFRRKVTS